MTSRPLLYLCVRPQQVAADAEYFSFRTSMRLGEDELHRHNLVTDPLPSNVVEKYSGIVVGGSPFNVSDSEKSDTQLRVESELDLLARAAAEEELTALFTCYGIGIVTRLLGGEVSTKYPEEASASLVTTTPDAAADPLSGHLPEQFHVLTAHKEGSSVPESAVLLATNDACPAQMYRYGTRLYATQFHPEPTVNDFTYRMALYRDGGYFAAEDYDRLAGEIEAADVTEPESILRAFVGLARN